MEFERRSGVVIPMVRQHIQKDPHQIQVLTRDIADLKNRANPLTHKLARRAHTLLSILDEDGYLFGSRGFQDLGELGDGLFEDLGRADVDFGNDDHDRDVEGKGDAEVFFGHADEAIVGSNHQEGVVGFGAKETEDGGAEVAFVAGEVGEGDYLGLMSGLVWVMLCGWVRRHTDR